MPHHHHHHRHHPHPDEALPPGLDEAVESVRARLSGSGRARRLGRLAFEEGPYHRRVSNTVLCALLSRLLDESGAAAGVAAAPGVEFEIDLPGRRRWERATVTLPTRLLAQLCPDEETLDEVVDGLIDGPEHEVAANVILLRLIESLAGGLDEAPRVEPAPTLVD